MDKYELEQVSRRLMTILTFNLPQSPEDSVNGYWTSGVGLGSDILCKTEESANAIADFLEELGFEEVNTGYYDPEEDERCGEVDKYTGWWYVSAW